MADDIDLTTAVATEVAKQIPVRDVYSDVAAPVAKQAGSLLEDIAKTLRLALAPLQYTAALQDRYVRFLNDAVRRVPEADRISPPPQILGPVVEGMRYEELDTPISAMFLELLAKAFDQKNVGLAHPSFPILIRQLSADEARYLAAIKTAADAGENLEIRYASDYDAKRNRFSNQRREKDDTPTAVLTYPENADFYFEHLHNLGLVGQYDHRSQEPIMAAGIQIGVRVFKYLKLSPMGERFMEAVSPATAR